MKTCPACRKRIDAAASKCHQCHSIFTDEQMAEGRREHSRQGRNTMLGVIAVLAGLVWWITRPENIDWMAEETARRDFEAESRDN